MTDLRSAQPDPEPTTERPTMNESEPMGHDCWPSTPIARFYQPEARRVFMIANDRDLMPWAWILTTCKTDGCLNAQHMVVHAPTRIQYPAGVCVFCGMPAGTKDHLLPRGKTGEARRVLVGEAERLVGEGVDSGRVE